MGFCNGYQAPGFMNAGGFGRGGGRGRGFRGRFPAGGPYWQGYAGYGPYEPADQKAFLKDQASALESELKFVRERLAELDKD
jgi:hypothetical protein